MAHPHPGLAGEDAIKLVYHRNDIFLVDLVYRDTPEYEAWPHRWIWRATNTKDPAKYAALDVMGGQLRINYYHTLATPELWPLLMLALLDTKDRHFVRHWLSLNPRKTS